MEKIKKCESLGVETDLLYNFCDWKRFKKILKEIPENPILENFEMLFDFQFEPDPKTWNIK